MVLSREMQLLLAQLHVKETAVPRGIHCLGEGGDRGGYLRRIHWQSLSGWELYWR
jgi:hypothetical protein